MKKMYRTVAIYIVIFSIMIGVAAAGSQAATSIAAQAPLQNSRYVIIDAGHGGVDGGATSCTGILESSLNLEIASRLNDLLHLLGISTRMIRTDDRSVYIEGETIAAQKASDLKERVRIVNSTNDAVLVSIHQNYFHDSRYYGAQVFYASNPESKELAASLQSGFKNYINPESKRDIKKAGSIYLLEHVNCTAVLIECGFLSNPVEETKLRSADYQQKICCVIATSVSSFLSNT